MYDPSLQSVVLGKLAKWERLTESDLNAMLRPEDRFPGPFLTLKHLKLFWTWTKDVL